MATLNFYHGNTKFLSFETKTFVRQDYIQYKLARKMEDLTEAGTRDEQEIFWAEKFISTGEAIVYALDEKDFTLKVW
jgi:hypothetical protein